LNKVYTLAELKNLNEINALITLLDDPDEEVYTAVRTKLLSYGADVIPNLEAYWPTTNDSQLQDRIDEILHEAFFQKVCLDLKNWKDAGATDLKEAYILICLYNFNHLDVNELRASLKKMYQSAWLEMNNYLSPVEQLNVLAGVVHSLYKLRVVEDNSNKPLNYYLNYLLESKQGNNYSLGAIYLIISDLLDIPIKAVMVNDQFILAYFDEVYSFMDLEHKPEQKIAFYIDPVNGMLYTQSDVDAYLKKSNYKGSTAYKKPLSNTTVIRLYLENLLLAYSDAALINEKEKEIIQLINIFEEDNIIEDDEANTDEDVNDDLPF
jgi:regulator of sirC expression with transglutaminase-like and TPR domain